MRPNGGSTIIGLAQPRPSPMGRGRQEPGDRKAAGLAGARVQQFRPVPDAARDQVGGPLTVLTVRNGGRYYVMDDTGGRPFTVEERRREFQPLISFGMYGAWVHMPRTTHRSLDARRGCGDYLGDCPQIGSRLTNGCSLRYEPPRRNGGGSAVRSIPVIS